MKETWARTVRKVLKLEVGLDNHGWPHPEWDLHGDLRRRHTPRDNGTCHLVEHHRRGMKMAEPSGRGARPPGKGSCAPREGLLKPEWLAQAVFL